MYEYQGNNPVVAALAVVCGGVVKISCTAIAALGGMAFWNSSLYKYTLDTIQDICAGEPRVVEKVVLVDKENEDDEEMIEKDGTWTIK